MAWRRRSLPLALILIGFACQWLPWARIDRATFQYHYYTSLPFVILGLAYFLAELWHGPSARTWLLARLAAAGALVAVPTAVAPARAAVRHLGRGPGQSRLPGLRLRQRGVRAHRADGRLAGHRPRRPPGAGSGRRTRSACVGGGRTSRRPRGPAAGGLHLAAGDGSHDRRRRGHRADALPRDPARHGAHRRPRPVRRRHAARPPAGRRRLAGPRRTRSAPLRHRRASGRWPSGSSSSSPTSRPCRCRPASLGCSRRCPCRPTTTTSSSRSTPPARPRRAW